MAVEFVQSSDRHLKWRALDWVERVLMALCDLLESPGGTLWLLEEGRGFVPAGRYNATQPEAALAADAADIGRFLGVPARLEVGTEPPAACSAGQGLFEI